MVSIKIENKEYPVKNIMELNVKDYFSIQDVMLHLSNSEDLQKIIGTVTDIPKKYLEHIDGDSFSEEDLGYILNAQFDQKPLNSEFGKGLIAFNDILVGTYLDILKVGSSESSQMDKTAGIFALLYSGDQNYTLEEFSSLQEDIINNMLIRDALETYQSFDEWRASLQKHYEGLWEESEEEENEEEIFVDEPEEEEEKEVNWGLEGAVMNLAGEDILKRNEIKRTITIIDMFEWLSFQLYKSEKERAKNKR